MKKKYLIFALFSFGSGILSAQWSPAVMQGNAKRSISEETRFYSLNLEEMRSQLKNAKVYSKDLSPIIIAVPTLEGKIEKFAVYRAPVLVKSLEDRYQLGSYSGTSVDDPSVHIRFSVAPNDFQSMVVRNGKYEFIEPLNEDKSIYGVFSKTEKTTTGKPFECSTEESAERKKQIESFENQQKDLVSGYKKSPSLYRTYRLAISVNGEYTKIFGGVAGAFTQINATMTRVNGVYERDFGIHLDVQDFPQLIFTDATTDPYSSVTWNSIYQTWVAPSTWNIELQRTLTSTIGNDAYDLGHFFGHRGGGGNAGDVGNVCRNPLDNFDDTAKGSAITSPAEADKPYGDNFDIDYVAHEMGHQLGADHTFAYGIQPSPHNVAQMEPGSGSTIMGYAGITLFNVQLHSDPYFLTKSIDQIREYSSAQNCGTVYSVTNTAPEIAPLSDKTIPKGTPFVLTASATDAEGDSLTYTWEQFDVAKQAVTSVTGDNVYGPKFRSLPPTDKPYRYFPMLSDVLNGNLSNAASWEAVSNVARNMSFKVTVRDNHADISQQQTQNALVNVTVGNDGPFKLQTDKIYNNKPSEVKWVVASTNQAPYNVADVKIDYSTDKGNQWNTLISSTPNDGSENVDFSNIPDDAELYLRISAIGNIFYTAGKVTVSKVIFCDGSAPSAVTVNDIQRNQATVSWDAVQDALYKVKYKKTADAVWTEKTSDVYSIQLQDLEEDTEYEVQIATVCSDTTGSYSSSVIFRTMSLSYCSSSASNPGSEYISNVTVISNGSSAMSSDSGESGYTSYTADASRIINLIKGSTGNKIFVTKKWKEKSYNETVVAWIDFNRNGIFEDSEKIISSDPNQNPTDEAEFSVPTNGYVGNLYTRMRVILKYKTVPSSACESFQYGEVEDYAVLINDSLLNTTDTSVKPVRLYPNPVNDAIHFINMQPSSRYKIYNLSGILIKEGTCLNGSIQVQYLPAGSYVVSLDNGFTVSHLKFIKQ